MAGSSARGSALHNGMEAMVREVAGEAGCSVKDGSSVEIETSDLIQLTGGHKNGEGACGVEGVTGGGNCAGSSIWRAQREGWETEECELLLDTYSRVYQGLHLHLKELEDSIVSCKDLTRLHLKVRRNKIVDADMRFELASCIVGAAYLVSAIFGQNLSSGWQTAGDTSPWLVIAGAVVGLILLCGCSCLRALAQSPTVSASPC